MGSDSFNWNDLAVLIALQDVVPVIGESVITVRDGKESKRVGDVMATRLAEACDMRAWPGASVRDVANRAVQRLSPNKIKSRLNGIHDQVSEAYGDDAIGPELKSLCSMKDWPLVLTTAASGFLESALSMQLGRRPGVVALGKGENIDAPHPVDSRSPMLVHLFGRISSRLAFQLTDEDVLECLIDLVGPRRPEILLDALEGKHLLFIGNALPDWAQRLFMRGLRRERLSDEKEAVTVVADDITQPRLTKYLSSNGKNVWCYTGDLSVFVDELKAAMDRKKGKLNQNGQGVTATNNGTHPVVFISCCSKDREAAARVAKRFDDRFLAASHPNGSGHPDTSRSTSIEQSINHCDFFVPLISMNAEAQEKGAFRKEWQWAARRLEKQTGRKQRFIYPLVIDETEMTKLKTVPKPFQRLSSHLAPDGDLSDEVLDQFVKALRANRAPIGVVG